MVGKSDKSCLKLSSPLQNHHGQGVVVFVAQGEVHVFYPGFLAELGRPARYHKSGFAHGVGDHLHLPPPDAAPAQTHAQGLGEGLLGGKAQGETRGGPSLPLALGDLLGSEDAPQKALAVALHGLGDALHPHQVNTDTVDHGRLGLAGEGQGACSLPSPAPPPNPCMGPGKAEALPRPFPDLEKLKGLGEGIGEGAGARGPRPPPQTHSQNYYDYLTRSAGQKGVALGHGGVDRR